MRLLLIIAALFLIKNNVVSQITFEPGYLIDNENKKVTCLIKNLDWENNPDEFLYKLSQEGSVMNGDLSNVQEFAIDGGARYLRAEVDLDVSGYDLQNLGLERNPVFENRTLFLKVLIAGKRSLYYFKDGKMERFFYSSDIHKPTQLVFKKYITETNQLKENNFFRQQLANELDCEQITTEIIKNTKYEISDLVVIFSAYNQCESADYTSFVPKKNKERFGMTIRPGITYTTLSAVRVGSAIRNFQFEPKIGYRIGLEGEVTLPFNKNKWSIIMEPSYRHFSGTTQEDNLNTPSTSLKLAVDYKSLDLPVGCRYSIFLKENSKIFMNTSFIFTTSLNSKFDLSYSFSDEYIGPLEVNTAFQWAFGAGYNMANKYSVELRYIPKTSVLNNFNSWGSRYESLQFILGYSLF